jgi:glycosyltransferase involved in cell wall biosynthesis
MDACRDASVPLVAHFHGFDAYRHDIVTAYKEKYSDLFKQAAAVIAVSSDMMQQLLALGAIKEKTFLNSCGADIPDDLHAHPGTSNVRFLMVGRLVEKKAPVLSIQAFAKVIDKLPDSHLDIIGDGPLLDVCKQTVKSLGLSDHIKLHGAQSHSFVLDMMKNSRCFIQHSICTENGDREGTPVAILEAMGVGLPVVSTRHGGISDVIANGSTGTLVKEHDIDAMAEAMMAYGEDPELAQRVGEEARVVIQENWTSEISTKRLWKIIGDAISK